MKKPLKFALMAAGISFLLFVVASLYGRSGVKEQKLIGGYTFVNSYRYPSDKMRIVLNDGKNNFNLRLSDGNWRVEEKNMYYADYNIVNFLLDTVKMSRVHYHETTPEDEFEFVPEWNIKIYGEDELLNEIYVKKNKTGKYLAKLGNKSRIYEVSGYFDFPHEGYLWLPQPLLKINQEEIYKIVKNERVFEQDVWSKEFSSDDKYNPYLLQRLLIEISYFDYSEPQKEPENQDKSGVINVEIQMESGQIYDIEVFKSGDDYYAKIKESVASAFDEGIDKYVEADKKLYEGWIFGISEERYKAFSEF